LRKPQWAYSYSCWRGLVDPCCVFRRTGFTPTTGGRPWCCRSTLYHQRWYERLRQDQRRLVFSHALSFEDDIRHLKSVTRNHPRRPVNTQASYSPHLAALHACGILGVSTGFGIIHWWHSYFCHRKGATGLSRGIVNCKALAASLEQVWPRKDRPVCLPPVPTLLRAMAGVLSRTRQACIYLGDLRHWYHQFLLPPEMARFFGVCLDGGKESWVWRTLPMGYTNACRAASTADGRLPRGS